MSECCLPLFACRDSGTVGGKAIHLARMAQAGFPVPGGFVLSTAAHRLWRAAGAGDALPSPLRDEVAAAYAQMGSPTVAVRSSATAEDREDASMAGQYETILNVRGLEALCVAILQCWRSLESPRVQAYLSRHGLRPGDVNMGVVVQEQVAADVAGVLFTANPRGAWVRERARDEMLIEASWGLGESVVSGEVQPDTLVVDAENGDVLSLTLGSKETLRRPDAPEAGPAPTPEALRTRCCLRAAQVLALWRMGRQVAAASDVPQDVEWAFAGDTLFLLQARAITTIEVLETREAVLRSCRDTLRDAIAEGRGPWVRHNLGETLPHPTPLTWEVIRSFMSGDGGFGALHRRLGFEPAPALAREGFLDLIAGRIHMDLSRAPEMFFPDYPFVYDVDRLRRDPGAAQEPPTLPKPGARLTLALRRRLQVVARRLENERDSFGASYLSTHLPAFEAWVRREKQCDLSTLDAEAWVARWQERKQRVLQDFAPLSLLPSLIVNQALQDLRGFLREECCDEDAEALCDTLATGGPVDLTLQSAQLLRDAAEDEAAFTQWLERFGHRGPGEMELNAARWRECPEAARSLARHMRNGESPLVRHQRQQQEAETCRQRLLGLLPPPAAATFGKLLGRVHRYLHFREDGKHALMLGYDLLRDLLLEASRRLEIGDGVGFLHEEELFRALRTGLPPLARISRRRQEHAVAQRLTLPPVVDAAALDTLGQEAPLSGGDLFDGLAVSPGQASGPALILHRPEAREDLAPGYILVCPSTDPNWTPLFAGAAGLVLECGGALSHGAVVAREMGLPAVVLPDATRRFQGGERLGVDGHRGRVARGDVPPAGAGETPSAAPAPLPPPPGPRERSAARLRNRALVFWSAFFALYYALPPSWLQQPVTRLTDRLYMPLLARVGAPAFVAGMAILFALLCMAGQAVLTDAPRLRLAARRLRTLQRQIRGLAPDAPERRRVAGIARQVTRRNLMASFVPLSVFLGPMMLTFLWFPERVEPLWRNAPPYSPVLVSVQVEGDHGGPVRLRLPEGFHIRGQAETQTVPPIRATLEGLLRDWSRPPDFSHLPTWEEQAAARHARTQTLDDLRAYLRGPMPPQTLAWRVTPPPGAEGRFPLQVETGGGRPLNTHMVFGDSHAPEPRDVPDPNRPPLQVVRGPAGHPLRELRVAYSVQRGKEDLHFWRPIERFARPPLLSGWLLTYLLAYLPAMFVTRRLFRVP